MSEFITPPRQIEIAQRPIVFLAGPVQGTYDWQATAAERLLRSREDMDVVSPRGGEELYSTSSVWHEHDLQIDWEKHHLRLAKKFGVLSMWLQGQDYDTPGRCFAQTSRIEFGRIAGWIDYDPSISFVFGIHPSYQGGNANYFTSVCRELGLPVHKTADAWCEDIIDKVRVKNSGIR